MNLKSPETTTVDDLEIPDDWPGLPSSDRMSRMAAAAAAVRDTMDPLEGQATYSPSVPDGPQTSTSTWDPS